MRNSEEKKQKMQDILDYVVMGIVSQGGPSVDKSGREPRYRGEGGRCCPAGLLISDDDYRPNLEGVLVEASVVCNMLPSELRSGLLFILVRDLQCAHDRSVRYMYTGLPVDEVFFSSFENCVQDVCARFSLEYPDHLI